MMKVYEIAKEYQLASKELVRICAEELSFAVKAQNKLTDEQHQAVLVYLKKAGVAPAAGETTHEVKAAKSQNASEMEGGVKSKAKSSAKKASHKKSENPEPKNTIAYIVSECEPFTNLGDLGEKTLEAVRQTTANGENAIVVMPHYQQLHVAPETLEWVMDIPVYLGSIQHRASISRLQGHGITYLFVGNEYFFGREGIYGHEDDLERFAFFNRGALAALPYLAKGIKEVQLNDWHTSIFALLQKIAYGDHPYYKGIKTVLNINDLSYQGWYGPEILTNVLGIAHEFYTNGLTRMGDSVNILKSGIETADIIRLTRKSQGQVAEANIMESGISSIVNNKLTEKTA
ncbi:MAG: glycogen/starch synthase [Turicibacter sp.]|nr:glycogen/starch synthase [Turicibacter sp.]